MESYLYKRFIQVVLIIEALLFCYADDCGLWYELTDDNRSMMIGIVNLDQEQDYFRRKQDLYDCDVKQSSAFRPDRNQL